MLNSWSLCGRWATRGTCAARSLAVVSQTSSSRRSFRVAASVASWSASRTRFRSSLATRLWSTTTRRATSACGCWRNVSAGGQSRSVTYRAAFTRPASAGTTRSSPSKTSKTPDRLRKLPSTPECVQFILRRFEALSWHASKHWARKPSPTGARCFVYCLKRGATVIFAITLEFVDRF